MAFNNATPAQREQVKKFLLARGGNFWAKGADKRIYFNNVCLEKDSTFHTFYLDISTEGAWKFVNTNGQEVAELGKAYYNQLAEIENRCNSFRK